MDKRRTTISVCLILLSIGVAVAGSVVLPFMPKQPLSKALVGRK